MATMVQCATVLVIKRFYEKHKTIKNNNPAEINRRERMRNIESKNELLDETPDQTSKPRAIIEIRKNTFFSSKQRISESSNHKQKDLDTVELDNISNLTHLVPSPKSIEIAALILFPASYVMFNIFYWMLII